MLRALIKKDFARLLASLTTRKTKKLAKPSSGKGGVIGILILWAFIFLSLAMAFAGLSHATGSALIPIGFDWLYYCLTAMSGFVVAIIINGFMANSVLFNAKDNELLLAMPIPSGYILLSRMTEIFVLNLIYSAVVIIPAFVVRCILKGVFDGKNLIFCIVVLILMTFSETAVSSILGWIISAISKKVKNKSLVTVVVTLVFLGGYYYFYFNVNKYIALLVENSLTIGAKMESSVIALPVVKTGLALAGDLKALLSCIVLTAVLFGVTYYVLSRTFIKVATTSSKTVSKKYDAQEQAKVQLVAPAKALLRKEFARFAASPTYILNCGLGAVFMIIGAVLLFIKKTVVIAKINEIIPMFEGTFIGDNLFTKIIPIGGVLVVILLMGTLDISAPSISLEGKSIWILQSLPADPVDVFSAKQNLEFYIAAPVSVLFLLAYAYVFSIEWSVLLIMVICVLMFIKCHAALGVLFNLKFPKLDWTSEAVPIKQSLPVCIVLFGSWLVAIALGAVYYFLLKDKLDAYSVIVGLMVIFALGYRLANKWINTKGVEIFRSL